MMIDNYDIGISGNCSGIYCFENLLNGKRYVGKGKLLARRIKMHFWLLNNDNYNDSKYFQYAWNKYGKENFKLWIVEECSIELLEEKEKYWIKELHSHYTEWGYNLTLGGEGIFGYKHSSETIQKMKDNSGMKNKHHSPETIQKIKDNLPDMSGENNSFYGKKHSSETIQKMIVNHADFSGEKHPNWGKQASEETRQKQRKSHLGKKQSKETIQKRKDANSGINNFMFTKKESVQQIKDMLDMGISMTKIAKELKICRKTVRKVKDGFYEDIYGITGIPEFNLSTITSGNIIQQVKILLDKNIKASEIAKRLGIGNHIVYKTKNGFYKSAYGIKGNNNKKEIIQQIKNMSDDGISTKNIKKCLNIGLFTIYKVKNGGYKDIYGI